MSTMAQTGEWATDNLRLLAYVQHMAQTAQPAAARRLFELFAQWEKRRIEAKGAPVRLTRSGSRIERMKAMWRKSDTARGEPMKKATGRKGKRVNFQVTVEPGCDVFVAGSFNQWNPTQYRMSDNPGSGHCKTTLVLPAGRHEYKFIVNGEWRADSNCAEWTPNDQGSLNSVISV